MKMLVDSWTMNLSTTIFIIIAHLSTVSCNSNSTRINVYFEPQNEESTRFIKDELLPLFQDSEFSSQIHLKLIPFGRAKCDASHQNYICTCTNGDNECQLMHLMACTLQDYRHHHENALEMISCIQGQPNFDQAYQQCIKKLPEKESQWLRVCPSTFRGQYLSWLNGLRTRTLSSELTTMPVITMNGKYNLEPTNLRAQICKNLEGSSKC